MKLLVTLKNSLGRLGNMHPDNIDYTRKVLFTADTVLFVYKTDNFFIDGHMLHSLDGAVLYNNEYFSDISIEPVIAVTASGYRNFSPYSHLMEFTVYYIVALSFSDNEWVGPNRDIVSQIHLAEHFETYRQAKRALSKLRKRKMDSYPFAMIFEVDEETEIMSEIARSGHTDEF